MFLLLEIIPPEIHNVLFFIWIWRAPHFKRKNLHIIRTVWSSNKYMNSLFVPWSALKQNCVPIQESSRDWKMHHLWPELEACSTHFEPLRPPLKLFWLLNMSLGEVVHVCAILFSDWWLVVHVELSINCFGCRACNMTHPVGVNLACIFTELSHFKIKKISLDLLWHWTL